MSGESSRVLWYVIVDRAAEDLWRTSLGQADIEAWCAAHGWKADDVFSDSVEVTAFIDGRVEVTAEVVSQDAEARFTASGELINSRKARAPYRRPLPEGIAPVRRP